ncbi:MAG: AsmA family protein [Bacteroidales bacterium]|nr:AsmA family protein [Bacteroidales bacterium]
MLRKIVKIVGIVLIVIVIAIVSIPFLFKDKIVQMVKEEINNNLNAQVNFDDFELSILKSFPNASLDLTNLTIVGINEFKTDTLLQLPSLSVTVNVMSLFSDQIKIKSIELEKPTVNIIVLKNGKANWDIVKESTDSIESETDTTPSNFALALKKLSINQATVKYRDDESNMQFFANNLNYLLKGDLTAERTELKNELSLQNVSFIFDNVAFLKNASINVAADIDANLKDQTYTFKNNQIEINKFITAIDGMVALPNDTDIVIDVKYEAQKTDFKTLLSLIPAIYLKDFETVKTNGQIEFNGTVKGTYNEQQMPGFSLNLKINQGSFQYPQLPSSVSNINVELAINNADGNPDHTVINLKKFHAETANNPIDAQLFVTTPVSNPNLKGMIKGKFDLSQVSSFYPLSNATLKGKVEIDAVYETTMNQIEQEKYDEINAKGYIKLNELLYSASDLPYQITIPSMETEITPRYFDLKVLKLLIGSSDINLSGKIENMMAYLFKDDLLKGNFTLTSHTLNVNTFLTSDETEATASTTSDTSHIEAPSIPKNIDFTFNADIKQLLYDNMDITNAKGVMILKNGKLNLDNLQFNALDGMFNLKAHYEYSDIHPKASFMFSMKNLDIRKTYQTFTIIKQMIPIAQNCAGKISVVLDMETTLNKDLTPMLNTVNAKGSFAAPYIILENTETGKKLSEFLKNKQYETLKVEQISASFKIKDGNIEVEPVKTKIGNIPVEFYGSQNLNQSLNYDILLQVPKQALGTQANELFGQWTGAAKQAGLQLKVPEVIPVKGLIRGTITKPEIKFNLKDMAQQSVETVKEAVKEKINEEVDKAKAEAIRKAQEEADRLIKEAEQRANQIVAAAEAAAKQINETARQTAQQIRQEADAKASQIEKEGKAKGPIAEKLAKESAEKIRKEADKKANEIEMKAQQESQAKVNQAKAEAEQIKAAAKAQGDKLIEEAKKK